MIWNKYPPADGSADDGIEGPRSAWPEKLANDWLDRPNPDASDENDGPDNPINCGFANIGAAAGAAIGADSEIGCEKPPPCWAFQ